MTSYRGEVLRLYKCLLKEGSKFSSYNFRTYTQRRVKDAFREHKGEKDAEQIMLLTAAASKYLDVIKRQVIVGNLYKTDHLVIENK